MKKSEEQNIGKSQEHEKSESVLEKKDRELFDDIAEKYCRKDMIASSRIPRKHRLLRTLAAIPLLPGFTVLEVGCGCGYSAAYLEGLYTEYIGVDYAGKLIDFARKKNGGENVRFAAANINDYNPAVKVDLIIMIGVLHHFDEYEKTLKHILGMLKTGGWLVVNEPQSGNLIIQAARKIRTVLDKGYSDDQATFSYRQLKKLFEDQGLHNIRVLPQGVFSTPLAEVPLKPVFIFNTFARLTILLDNVFEAMFGGFLKWISWNLIAAGQKAVDE